MLDWTDRHERYFLRQISRHAVLYTEMVTTGALLHGDAQRYLAHDPAENPLALQLGGSDPVAMARCARMAEAAGFDEVNINVGCPSDRVQEGRFGACLMATPERVADCVAAMCAAVRIPVTVKHRIGIDEQDTEASLDRFVEIVSDAGCRTFIVHARKAWLQGLDPKQNRNVPPLDYPRVHRLKNDWPELEIILNGGIDSLAAGLKHLEYVDGVMLGRAAYQNPWILAEVDTLFYGQPAAVKARAEVIERMRPYIDAQLRQGVPLSRITRHMLGLYKGRFGGKHWRRVLSEHARRPGAGLEVIDAAMRQLDSVPPADEAGRNWRRSA